MDIRRILEILGGFVIGVGLTVMAYEWQRRGSGASQTSIYSNDDSLQAGARGLGTIDSSAQTPGVDGSPSANALDSTGSENGEVNQSASSLGAAFEPDENGNYKEFPPLFLASENFDDEAARSFPKHGLVESIAAIVREKPDLKSKRMGMMRAGTRFRTDAERSYGGNCSKGWHRVFPKGWVCLNAGVKIADTPPDGAEIDVIPLNMESVLPLDYWRVNHNATPFFHRLPTYAEQDQADAAGRAWLAEHGTVPMPTHPEKRPEDVPAVVKEYLNAGYYVTIASEHLRSKRYFLRTNRGVYAKKYQLEKKNGSDFRGIVLPNGDADLPVHWIVRSMPLMKRSAPGSGILTETEHTPERRSRYAFSRKIRIGDHYYYEDENGLLLRDYAVGKADKIKRPPGIGGDEPWVHVDLSEQVLVAYRGSRPVFTTLVSTGREPGMTPIGVHRVQSKFVATSMRDQPPEDEAYSIEDVPWTQYFSNNVALHGAFWHGGFGLVRSHGCVNLSPSDARWIFGFLEPHLPEGWVAAMPHGAGSAVVVTE